MLATKHDVKLVLAADEARALGQAIPHRARHSRSTAAYDRYAKLPAIPDAVGAR
jgi:hypothetical protein